MNLDPHILVIVPPNFGAVPTYLVPLGTFTLVLHIFAPSDLVKWMAHVFFNHPKISLMKMVHLITVMWCHKS